MSYLERNDSDLLRKRLREQDAVIDLAGMEVIGPDHDIFDIFSEDQSDSS